MPTPVFAAIAADFAATAVAEYVVFELGWGALATSLAKGATSFLVGSAINGALGGSQQDTPSFAQQAQARTHSIRSAVSNRPIIYGEVVVGGTLVFAGTDPTGQFLHLVVVLAGHECESIEAVYFNDEEVGPPDVDGTISSGTFANHGSIFKHLGAADQAADANLVAAGIGWTSDHRLRGVCYLHIGLAWNRDTYPRGIPAIKARVRGKKLYDPRTGLTEWSDNWALACRDYLASDLGLRCTDAEIDDTAVIAAANIADEPVTLAAGGTEPRYTCNAVLDTGATPKSNMQTLLSGGAGALTWPAGLYTLHAGAYEAPTVTLDEDDLRGAVRVRARVGRQDLYNAVKGTFVDPDKAWQPTDYPPVTNSSYETQDGGTRIWRELSYPVTTSSATAQRLAKLALEKSRQGITVDLPCKMTAFKLRAWDTVALSLDHLGWDEKVFRVTGWTFGEAGGIDLTLQEEAAACYAWSAEETIADPAPDTTLPDPFTVSAPGVPDVTETLFDTTGSAGVKARATMAWAASDDAFVVDYLPEYRASGGEWIVLPPTTGLAAEINDIAPGIYEFRLRARNALGVTSDYGGTRTQEILGLTAPPGDVADFYVLPMSGRAHARWALTSDLDVRLGGRCVIRHSSLASGASWEDGVILEEFAGSAVAGTLPLLGGTYLAKFQDSSGNWSDTAASFYASDDWVNGWTVEDTLTEDPGFSGTKTGVVVSGGDLQLDSDALIDGLTDLIDTWASIDSLGGIEAAGSYGFSATMDLATVATRNFIVSLTALASDTGDLVDARTSEIDYWDSIDGATINDCTVQPYIRTTPDNPAGSPTWSAWTPFWVADFNCRAAQFRLDFTSGNSSHNIAVSALEVRARALA